MFRRGLQGPVPPCPDSTTYSAPSGPMASPRGLSSPLMITVVVTRAVGDPCPSANARPTLATMRMPFDVTFIVILPVVPPADFRGRRQRYREGEAVRKDNRLSYREPTASSSPSPFQAALRISL